MWVVSILTNSEWLCQYLAWHLGQLIHSLRLKIVSISTGVSRSPLHTRPGFPTPAPSSQLPHCHRFWSPVMIFLIQIIPISGSPGHTANNCISTIKEDRSEDNKIIICGEKKPKTNKQKVSREQP